MSLDRTFPPDASRDGFIRAPAAAAAGTNADQSTTAAAAAGGSTAAAGIGPSLDRWHLRGLEQVPWDWSVKSRLKLGSAAPFAVLQERAITSLASGECNVQCNTCSWCHEAAVFPVSPHVTFGLF